MSGIKTVLLTVFLFCWIVLVLCSTPFYVDNGLQQTVILDNVSKKDTREIQIEILALLGLKSRPKSIIHNYTESAPIFMLDVYRYLTISESMLNADTEFHAGIYNDDFPVLPQEIEGSDVIMSFVNHASRISHLLHVEDQTFFFEFGEVPSGERIKKAELRLYKQVSVGFLQSKFTVEFFKICQDDKTGHKFLQLEVTHVVGGDDEGWLRINVTHVVEMWTLFFHSNMGLYMHVLNSQGSAVGPDLVGIVGRNGRSDQQAFLIGYFDVAGDLHSRQARSARRVMDEDLSHMDDPYVVYGRNVYSHLRHQSCQRRSLYVSFRDLGWQDWIIAPDGYTAFYCNGECSFPLGAHMNATNHAIVQTLVHLLDPRLVPKPCCTPSALSPISVLYFDHNSNVVLKRYRDMIVKSCGCH